jgi:hypothetical protein
MLSLTCTECELKSGMHRVGCPNRIKTKTSKTLYCICYEYKKSPGIWDCDKLYLHADDAGDARLQFFRSDSPETMREIRIVGIAPVIGYFVDDNKGNELSV